MKMKNRFCTFYLFAFGFFGLWLLVREIVIFLPLLKPMSISQETLIGMIGDTIILLLTVVLACIQTFIAFFRKLRWTARIIGLYVIALFASILIMRPTGGWYTVFIGYLPAYGPANLFVMFSGPIALVLFFWALKDLSKGHYLEKK